MTTKNGESAVSKQQSLSVDTVMEPARACNSEGTLMFVCGCGLERGEELSYRKGLKKVSRQERLNSFSTVRVIGFSQNIYDMAAMTRHNSIVLPGHWLLGTVWIHLFFQIQT